MPLVSFAVDCASAGPGEQLRAVGSAAALGSWAPERSCAVLRAGPEDLPRWRSEWLAIPSCSSPVEYKYMVCSGTGEVRWESRANRALDLSASSSPDDRLEVREAFACQEPALETPRLAAEALASDAKAADLPALRMPRTDSKESGVSTAATVGGLASLASELDDAAGSSDCGGEEDAAALGQEAGAGSAGEEAAAAQSPAGAEEAPDVAGALEEDPDLTAATFEEGFELRRPLGDGAFGVVHGCVARCSGQEYAVKVVRKEGLHPLDLAGLECETRLQRALPAHANVVRLHAAFEDAEAVRLVLDLCPGGDLYILLDDAKQRSRWRGGDLALSDRAAARVGRQLLGAVAFLHAQGVVHRDVKPENVLLASPPKQVPLESPAAVVKLCDFGYAVECRPDEPPALREFVGSADYLAPEVARREAYGCAVDVWSAGAVLFECLRGRAPFTADTETETIRRIGETQVAFDDDWARVSAGARSCVERLMVEQAGRPRAEAALAHPWLARAFPQSK